MHNCEALNTLGTPTVRNAILLNELGALLHDVGKLSEEFLTRGGDFPHHLVLRRLTRGRDAHLANGGAPRGDEKLTGRDRSNLEWQIEQEEAIASLQPPFFPGSDLVDRLDELSLVADLVEQQGRTWHPRELLSPEVRLLRAIHRLVEHDDPAPSSRDQGRLSQVRYLFCEVLANQLLEIVNIRKDGPGDLGSWFWKARLYARGEAGLAALKSFDEGLALTDQEMESVLWLGVRAIAQWAYTKVVVAQAQDGSEISLWHHCRRLCALFKSSLAGALIEGRWLEDVHLSWSRLRVALKRPDPDGLQAIKHLVEVEYPLGNEMGRSGQVIDFSFPSLEGDVAEPLTACLKAEVMALPGNVQDAELSIQPLPPMVQ